ncbi:MAG TPA: RNA polymerase sporulation sigma factor SigK [Spirochaetia bacterium]|nr:RNA polymerase sporulation sigma factor SigK [Spirochaetia bacterium]
MALVVLSLLNGLLVLVSYVANNAFPPPLSEEEEAACIRLLKQGDEKAKNTLIERNLRLVAHVVKKFDNVYEDQDDLISIGTIGLIKAINAFDPQKGTKLATFAAKCVENEILMHMRVMKKVRSEVYLFEPIGVDKEGNEITLIDILGTHAEVVAETVENTFDKRELLTKMQLLSKREKKVLELRFGLHTDDKKTQREIAKSMGISRSYVSRIEKKALNKLTRELVREGSAV